MTNATAWRVAIGKEVRALLPIWSAAMAGLALTPVFRRFGLGDPRWGVFLLGTFTLGALSIGHEYLSRTLPTFLALPVSRARLMMAKLVALAVLLLPLAGLTALLSLWAIGTIGTIRLSDVTLVVPLCFALCVAPWMTMLARGPLGGTVFTIAALVAVGAALPLWERAFGTVLGGGWRLTPSPFVVFCAAAAVVGWRAFMRLEAPEGERDLRISGWSRAEGDRAPAGRPNAAWALAKKELQIQQTTLLVAAFSITAIALLAWFEHQHYGFSRGLTHPASMLHLAVIPILAGALASAEERSLGTLEWQTLQPIAAWKQWTIKFLVVIGLALVLGIGGPALIRWIDPGADLAIGAGRSVSLALPITVVFGLAIVSLYVSSLSTSGLRAAIVSVPVIAAMVPLVYALPVAPNMTGPASLNRIFVPLLEDLHRGHFTSAGASLGRMAFMALIAVLAFGAIGLLLKFGLENHRSAARGGGRIARQAAAVMVWWLISIIGLSAASAWYWTGMPWYPTRAQRQAVAASRARRDRWNKILKPLVAGFDGRVGVCVADHEIVSACVNEKQPFPMQSVMKLPVAVAVLEHVDQGELRLDEPILVRKQDLSVYVQPIAKLVGPNGFQTTIDDLLRRAIVDSDNAAADILMARIGGPDAVRAVLNRKGLTNIHVDRDEKHLQTEINGLEWRPDYLDSAALDRAVAAVPADKREAAFQAYLRDERDTSTPLAMSFLLGFLADSHLLSQPSCEHLIDFLRLTTTFPDRLKAGVPEGWTIGHKTGTSGDWRGVTAATNDVGIITGPDGAVVTIAVFIADSRAPAADRAALMAKIARAFIETYK